MDTAGADACRPFIERAAPTHPSLIDVGHLMAERFGVVNIPNGLWIDEDGVIVRPAEPAFPGPRTMPGGGDPGALPSRMRETLAVASTFETDEAGYVRAMHDWARHGADSTYALTPEEVVARSGPRDRDTATAAAHFDLAQHLHRAGDTTGAVRQFREAHRLAPDNISYKRQAWSLVASGAGPFERLWQGPVEGQEDDWPYESDWLTEMSTLGPHDYYPPMR
jgi:Tetratricopeptide repeat